MHDSALKSFIEFKETYLDRKQSEKITIIEIGSQAINSSVKNSLNQKYDYTGTDIIAGENVDVVLKDPYKLPFSDESIDAVISISTFEHTEFFWLTYIMMKVKCQ